MTKKGYQAIARAIYETTAERCSVAIPLSFDRCRQPFTRLSGGATGCPVHGIREGISRDPMDMREDVIRAIADVMAADSPRFDRARFVRACETGDMRDPAKVPPPPPCVVAMGCLCAGHARNPRRKTCDTREVSR